jgi:hypothetical protein
MAERTFTDTCRRVKRRLRDTAAGKKALADLQSRGIFEAPFSKTVLRKRQRLPAMELVEQTKSAMTQHLDTLLELESQLTADALQAVHIRDQLSKSSSTGTDPT